MFCFLGFENNINAARLLLPLLLGVRLFCCWINICHSAVSLRVNIYLNHTLGWIHTTWGVNIEYRSCDMRNCEKELEMIVTVCEHPGVSCKIPVHLLLEERYFPLETKNGPESRPHCIHYNSHHSSSVSQRSSQMSSGDPSSVKNTHSQYLRLKLFLWFFLHVKYKHVTHKSCSHD